MVVGRRRPRDPDRRLANPAVRWAIFGVVVLLLAGGGIFAYVRTRPTGLDALPSAAIAAPGGFRASVGANHTITVGLEVRNVSTQPVTLVSARIVAPPGLTSVNLTVVPTGDGNKGFAIEGDLPPAAPVRLGTEPAERNAIIAARFKVDCANLLASGAPTGEQIFVTIQVGDEQRTEEITPPVVDDTPWLTATARRACLDPVPTATAPGPLPPDGTPGP
jgi:hypothetical protein